MPLSVGKLLRQAQSYLKAGKRTDTKDLNKKGLSKPLKDKNSNFGNQNLQSKIFPSGQPTSEPTSEQINELIALYNDGEFEKGLLKIKYLLNFFPQAVVLFNLQGAFNAGLLAASIIALSDSKVKKNLGKWRRLQTAAIKKKPK